MKKLRIVFFTITFLTLFCFRYHITGSESSTRNITGFSLISGYSKYAFGVPNSSRTGVTLTQDIFKDNSSQRFKLIPSGERDYYFVETGYRKFLDINSGQGVFYVIQNKKKNIDSQKWKIEGEFNSCRIINKQTNKAVSIENAGKEINAKIVLSDISDNPSQIWQLWELIHFNQTNYHLHFLLNDSSRIKELFTMNKKLIQRINQVLSINCGDNVKSTLKSVLTKYAEYLTMHYTYLGYNELDKNYFQRAKFYYDKIKEIQKQRDDILSRLGTAQVRIDNNIKGLSDIFMNRIEMGEIRPQCTQKIGVLFVKNIDIDQVCSKDKRWIKKLQITKDQYQMSVFQQMVLKSIIEIHSEGNLSLEFKRYFKDISMKHVYFRYSPYIMSDADIESIQPDISDILYDINKNCDTIMTILPSDREMTSGGSAGSSTRQVIIPYHMNGSARMYMNIPAFWGGYSFPGGLLHEYIHTVESAAGMFIALSHASAEAFEKLKKEVPDYPGWKTNDRSELNYLSWSLKNTIPKKIKQMAARGDNRGWKIFAWTVSSPNRIKRELFEFNRREAIAVPLENRKKSLELMKLAHQAWKEGKNELCDSLCKQALEINPACFDAIRHFGNRNEERGKFLEAIKYISRYIQFTHNPDYYAKLGYIYAKKLKRFPEGMKYFHLGIQYIGNDERRKANYCFRAAWSLIDTGQHQHILALAEQGIGYPRIGRSLECEFIAGESMYQMNNRQKGLNYMISAMKKGLNKNKWYAVRLKVWTWNLLNSGKYTDAIAIAEIGAMSEDAVRKNQCLFCKGESLYRLGKKEEGIQIMRSTLPVIGNWWIHRFQRLTGQRYLLNNNN